MASPSPDTRPDAYIDPRDGDITLPEDWNPEEEPLLEVRSVRNLQRGDRVWHDNEWWTLQKAPRKPPQHLRGPVTAVSGGTTELKMLVTNYGDLYAGHTDRLLVLPAHPANPTDPADPEETDDTEPWALWSLETHP